MAGKHWLNCLKQSAHTDSAKKGVAIDYSYTDETDGINADDTLNHRSDPEGCCHDDIVITEDLIDPDYLLDPPENWEFEVNATSAKELEARGYLGLQNSVLLEEEETVLEEEEGEKSEVILPPNKMSVAVQVVNGREHGGEADNGVMAQANLSMEELEAENSPMEEQSSPQEVPDNAHEVPDTSDEEPNTSAEVLDVSNEVPDTSDDVPSSHNQVPSTPDVVPSGLIEDASSMDEVPSIAAEVPASPAEVTSSSIEVPSSQSEEPASHREEPSSPTEVPMSDGEEPMAAQESEPSTSQAEEQSPLQSPDSTDAPKKKKFKPWKSIKKIFKKKKPSKGSETDTESADTPAKSKSKSTGELQNGDDEAELDKRISMSEDSVFTPDKASKEDSRNSFTLNTSNLAEEISAKLKERASSSDDGFAQSSEVSMTTGDTTHDNSIIAPSDSSKTDSGIITTEDERQKPQISKRRWKTFSSPGAKESHHVSADMKKLRQENPGDVDLDMIQTSSLLPSSAAKHRISVQPSNRRPSAKARARTPQKRSSSRLDDIPTPIEEEPTTPTKRPTLPDTDIEKSDTPKAEEEHETPASIETPPREESPKKERAVLQCPKEVIIIMKADQEKKEEREKEEKKVDVPTTPTSPRQPAPPAELKAPPEEEEAVPPESKEEAVEEEKEEDIVEKEEEEKAEKEKAEKERKEKEDAIIEERRLSVAASKALFEAKMPEPTKSPTKVAAVNGHTQLFKTDSRKEVRAPETKGEADAKLSEKNAQIIKEEKDEKEEQVSLKDRISRYQNLATKSSVKGLTSHVPRQTPSKQRPVSTSNIENKDSTSPRKIAPKVPSKPSSTNSKTATTPDTSKPSIRSPPPSSSPKPTSPAAPTPHTVSSNPLRKPLQPTQDKCMVCKQPISPNDCSKFEGRTFHRSCQSCVECSRKLTLWNIDIIEEKLYCKQHGTVIKNNVIKEKLIIK